MRHARNPGRRATALPAVGSVAVLAALVAAVSSGAAVTGAGIGVPRPADSLGAVNAAAVNAAGVNAAAVSASTVDVRVTPAQQTVARGEAVNYTIIFAAQGGFSGDVTPSTGSLPSGVTATWSLASVRVTPAAPVTVTLTLTAAGSARPGNSSVEVRATARRDAGGTVTSTASLGLNVSAASAGSFTLAASPAALAVVQGGSGSTTVAVARSSFAASVPLTITGLPAGATASFSPNPVAGASAVLTLTAAADTPQGSWSLVVSGGATGRSSSTTIQLAVHRPAPITVTGNVPSPLAPGLPAEPVDLVLGNPNPVPFDVRALTVTVTGTSAGADCDASNFTVRQYTGTYPLRLGAGVTAGLAALGVSTDRRPQLQFLDKPGINQDACKGVTVFLAYSGTAGGS
jgi:hypothetical protein